MRIIAGSAKGIRLKMVPGNHVRPTADRVKESLFSVIGPFFDGGKGLDLFTGTGSLGLEAISRGMDQVYFVDQSAVSLRIARENAVHCGFSDQAVFLRRDARSVLKYFATKSLQFDLIFLDPPYHENLLQPVLSLIQEKSLLSPEGLLVVEHPHTLSILSSDSSFVTSRELSYGDTTITLLKQKGVTSA
ncbi:16S rRNA (guanine(966)-N(2))-methyltransferase RsmD [Shimazuella sp. AN120528]|uniref:16S rRNA (guanine(966)-N(2))-methyltransferase RsmD n=1 Tax=Shimazuella soli TaxID=1892854 RepID=UPI001F0DB547|nr:16S rRNA (guanine(966)-N(2))-methyltransferase RsmD [Shimazuella soli]MCH5584953.1 16S rRNA (guanine(966)-N(2))-methyltransferase RsmD [Shimazuella soli]